MRGFLPALHYVKGALGVIVYFTVHAHLDSDIYIYFIIDNFVFNTPSVLRERGNRLSPPGLPSGPV